jgi:exonuclease SbcD
MKILHTSDWHLGRTLCGRKRTREFEEFLDWLLMALREHGVDVLLVAGDVFDGPAPSARTQELYYRFLCRAAGSLCRHVVVVGGNHDSPSFLNAPKEILRSMNVRVVGAVTNKAEDELLTLDGPDGVPELLVCAVPYLRDRDVRSFEPGESVEDKDRKLTLGIERHYAEIGHLAEERRAALAAKGRRVPIVATGHLFATGGRTDEGVRELYVGSLARVDAGRFPACFDYLALGHLHSSQKVGNVARYSGAPLPMSPGEGRGKSVLLVEFDELPPRVTELPVPVFQEMERVTGDMDALEARLGELRARGSDAWVEVVYEGSPVPDLRRRVAALTEGSGLEILRVRVVRSSDSAPGMWDGREELGELDVSDVFSRCLEARKVPERERPILLATYMEVLEALRARE